MRFETHNGTSPRDPQMPKPGKSKNRIAPGPNPERHRSVLAWMSRWTNLSCNWTKGRAPIRQRSGSPDVDGAAAILGFPARGPSLTTVQQRGSDGGPQSCARSDRRVVAPQAAAGPASITSRRRLTQRQATPPKRAKTRSGSRRSARPRL